MIVFPLEVACNSFFSIYSDRLSPQHFTALVKKSGRDSSVLRIWSAQNIVIPITTCNLLFLSGKHIAYMLLIFTFSHPHLFSVASYITHSKSPCPDNDLLPHSLVLHCLFLTSLILCPINPQPPSHSSYAWNVLSNSNMAHPSPPLSLYSNATVLVRFSLTTLFKISPFSYTPHPPLLLLK